MRVNFHVLEGVGLGMGVLGEPGLALLVPFAQHWLCLQGRSLNYLVATWHGHGSHPPPIMGQERKGEGTCIHTG